MKSKWMFVIPTVLLALFIIASAPGATKALTLTITPASPTFDHPGQTITLTFTIQNTGSLTVERIVVKQFSNKLTCPDTVLKVGKSMTCTTSYTITEADFAAGKASIFGETYGYTIPSGWGCGYAPSELVHDVVWTTLTFYRVPDVRASLSLVKTADQSSFTQVGQQINYSYVVKNLTTQPMTGTLVVIDDRLAVTCPDTSVTGLAGGASLTCAGAYTVMADDLLAGKIVNDATATIGTYTSRTVSLEIPLLPMPSLSLAKGVTPNFYSLAGDTIHFGLTIQNTGNVTLAGPLVVNDSMLSGWTCTDLPAAGLEAGKSTTCSAAYVIPAGTLGTTLHNTATVSMTYNGAAVTSNQSEATVYYVPAVTPFVDCSPFLNPEACQAAGCYWHASQEKCIQKP